jgi:hypothetical protein
MPPFGTTVVDLPRSTLGWERPIRAVVRITRSRRAASSSFGRGSHLCAPYLRRTRCIWRVHAHQLCDCNYIMMSALRLRLRLRLSDVRRGTPLANPNSAKWCGCAARFYTRNVCGIVLSRTYGAPVRRRPRMPWPDHACRGLARAVSWPPPAAVSACPASRSTHKAAWIGRHGPGVPRIGRQVLIGTGEQQRSHHARVASVRSGVERRVPAARAGWNWGRREQPQQTSGARSVHTRNGLPAIGLCIHRRLTFQEELDSCRFAVHRRVVQRRIAKPVPTSRLLPRSPFTQSGLPPRPSVVGQDAYRSRAATSCPRSMSSCRTFPIHSPPKRRRSARTSISAISPRAAAVTRGIFGFHMPPQQEPRTDFS